MNYVCEFCKKTFSSFSNLNCHKKTAKYCLEKRGEYKESNICSKCEKSFTRKNYLEIHEKKCTKLVKPERIAELKTALKYTNKILKMQSKQISEYKSSMEKIAVVGTTKTTTTNINSGNSTSTNTNNILQFPLTQEWVNSNAKFLTRDHVKEGVYGLAKFAVDYPLKDRIAVADASRKTLKFKNENGEIIKDLKGLKTTKMVCTSIKEPVKETISKLRDEKFQEATNIENLENADDSVFDAAAKEITELTKVEIGIDKISENMEDEMQVKFVGHVCNLVN